MTAPVEQYDHIDPPPIGLDDPTFADEPIGRKLLTASGAAIAFGLVAGLVILLAALLIGAATP